MSNPKNFMDYVPRRNRNYQYEVDKDGNNVFLVPVSMIDRDGNVLP